MDIKDQLRRYYRQMDEISRPGEYTALEIYRTCQRFKPLVKGNTRSMKMVDDAISMYEKKEYHDWNELRQLALGSIEIFLKEMGA